MKKNNIILIILVIIVFEILTNSNDIMDCVKYSIDIWKNSLFLSLFSFFVISSLLIDNGIVEAISSISHGFFNKLFKINSPCVFIFLMSMFSGFPSSAKYIKELSDKKLISKSDAEKIILFSHFANPMFIIGTISISFLNNKSYALIILFCHYIVNFIIGIFLRKYNPSNNNTSTPCDTKKIPFGISLTKAILNSINTLLLILGTVTFFLIITTIISKNINLNKYIESLLYGIIEMTQGLKYISILDISMKLKCIIITMMLSFGGLSVHIQTFSIINDLKLNYKNYLLSRLIHSLLSGILVYLLFDIFY